MLQLQWCVAKRIFERRIANYSSVTLSHPLMTNVTHAATNSPIRAKTTVSSCCCNALFPLKRKRRNVQRRLGSFTGFNPLTGNANYLDTTEALLCGLPKSNPESLSIKMLRFENQFRTLGPKQAVIELNSVLHFWYKSLPSHSHISTTRPKSVVEMMEWVESMQPELQPNVSTYQMLLDAFIKRCETMQVAETVLDQMLEVLLKSSGDNPSNQSYDSLEVTSVTYSFHKIMTMHGKDRNPLASERLLRKLEKIRNEYKIPIVVNETYSIVISNWTKNGKPREAENVLYSMMNLLGTTRQYSNSKIMPTKRDFDSCLNAWVAYPTKVSGIRAEILVVKMSELSENGYDTKPNYKSYSKTVRAWLHSKHEYTVNRIDKILAALERMDWSGEKDNPYGTQTVAETYLAAMKACSYSIRSKDAVIKCVDFFSRLEMVLGLQHVEYETLQLMYAALIYTWAQSGSPETESRVQEIFNELDTRHKKYVAEHQSKVGDDLDFSDPYLCITVYRALLTAFAKTGSGHKAETVLKRMMNEYIFLLDNHPEDDNQLRMVDTLCFNNVLLAWSRSAELDAGYRAETLFRQMNQSQSSSHMKVRLDVVSYNAVLSAMAGSTDVEVARRGDTYFRQIVESKDTTCRASAITYTKAISLWSNIGTMEALNRATELLEKMEASNDKLIRPMRQTYKEYLEVLRKCVALVPHDEYQMRVQRINWMIKKS